MDNKRKIIALLMGLSLGGQSVYAQGYSSGNVSLFCSPDTLRGVQIGAFSSVVRQQMRGVSLAGIINSVGDDMRGVQISGVSNVVKGGNGMQLSLFNNVSSSPFRGVQLSGLSNVSMGMKRGLQIAAANVSSSYMRGLQLGGYNYADTLNGSQIGLFNVCVRHPRGVQIGVINYSQDTIAHKIGLVNVNPKTRIDYMFYGGSATKANLAVRFRNRSTYNILGIGTHYFGLDEKFSGALFYRIGQYFQLSPKFSLSGDLGFYHVESFQEHSQDKPERLYSLQARINADYQLGRYTSAFASVGYGDTHYYHGGRYRRRAIVEAGLAVRLQRASSFGNVSARKENEYDMEAWKEGTIFAFDDPERQKKHPWKAALEAFAINVGVQCFDQFVMNEEFAKISFHSIKHNIETGFVWDNDQFSTNLFAHPYHGGLYFNAARSHGMNFWESVPYSFCGSLMWETTCEIEPPAINDLMATTFGGVAIGEVTHRVSNLVFDDRLSGFPRFMREFLGTLICPIKGLNRILSGDAWRVRGKYYKYHDYQRSPISFSLSAGYRYLADNNTLFRGEGNPYVRFNLVYGDPFDGETTKPYDYFTLDATFGLSSNQPLITGLHLLGRLWSVPVEVSKGTEMEFGIFQHFNYYDSQPVKDGTSLVPYRISEAASFGPGIIYRFPQVGNLTRFEQRVFLDGILLGGSLTDYYNVIDRDYNMGSGYSVKAISFMEFGKVATFQIGADYYRIFTWKGYEGKDLATTDPLYLNAQGDKGNASLLVLNARFGLALSNRLNLDFNVSNYWRDTHYSYHDDVTSKTFDMSLGLQYKF
ncbi:DUF3943 domain-containing protein [Prevotella copri]|uniref:DUF3943 domain-containing protein n=1 Tax=Segatella copri TaxID=165179 RepID=A0AAP3B9S8_9BACT|nr:DUF3943 domain-containing protein [Segatella copri]MCW4127048.1 DUF3943 domain-containing protein [Segatella copri]MCW4414013.1 DUF3943 domain-containing protein [Segatella copri]MCW4420650.1 DUF3943 domain-containing protein [Segatella copri]